jgi:trigger factor
MKVSVEEISEIARRLHVELPEDKVDHHLKKAYSQLSRTAKIKGFRPGKVPLAILKRHYADQVSHEVGLELVNETLMEALEQTGVQAISQSDLDREPLQEGEPFRYSFLVEVQPEIVVRDYQKIPAQRQRLIISDEEVNTELELRRQANSHLESPEEPRPIQQGDHAVLDFEAFVEGKPVPDGQAKGFHLEVGSNRFSPEFENQLIGASMGEQREIEVTFPPDYGNIHLAGKNATLQVVIEGIKEKVLPELDDSFAKNLGEFESLEDLRGAVRQELESSKKNQLDGQVWAQIQDELINRNPFEAPQSMVEQELQRMLDTILYRLEAQNITLEQVGMDENTFKENNRDAAEKRVRITILLEKIALQEGFEISDEELDQGLRRSAEDMNQTYEQVKDFYQKSNVMETFRRNLLEEKAINFLREQADITEVEAVATDPEEDKIKREENS